MGMTFGLVSIWLFYCFFFNGVFKLILLQLLTEQGMSMTGLPLTIWAFFVTAIGVSFPVLFLQLCCYF
jgi:cytochrome c oxidase subunit 1